MQKKIDRQQILSSGQTIENALKELYQAFGEPVRPVSEYCQAFYDWRDALQANEVMPETVKALDAIYFPVIKSNYLWRRIYGDGVHRTEKCPEHKGRWSGYGWSSKESLCKYGCQHGYDITGWLPEEHEFVIPPDSIAPEFDEQGKVTKIGVQYPPKHVCYQCGGTLEDGNHK